MVRLDSSNLDFLYNGSITKSSCWRASCKIWTKIFNNYSKI